MTEAAQAAETTAETTAEKPAKEPKIEQNGVTRPSAGTKTARVWEISDTLSAAAGKPAKRREVLVAAVEEEINVATAATQYGRWRKFFGLGKEEAEAAPATASDVTTEPEAAK